MAKSITYQNYVIHINDNGIVTLSKDGVLFRNQAAGSRELASVLNLDVEPDCRRKKLNRLIIKEIARLNGIEEPVICDEDDEEETIKKSNDNLDVQTQEIQNNKNSDDLDEDDELDDDDEEDDELDDEDDTVIVDGVWYTAVFDDDLTTPLYFSANLLDEDNDAKEITIQSEITWPSTGKKYPVTSFSISDGEFMRVILPNTINSVVGAFEERSLEDRKNIEVIIAEGSDIYMQDRIFYDKEGYLQNAFLANIKGSFVVPNGVTIIASLGKQKSMEKVIIPESVKEICAEAFKGDTSLKEIQICNKKENLIWFDEDENETHQPPTIKNCVIRYVYSTVETNCSSQQQEKLLHDAMVLKERAMHLTNQQQATMHNDDGASKTPAFYQKHYQYMYDRDRWKVWDNIIPENAEEMIGALMFCKVHKDNSSVVETLQRLHELCSLHYADNEEINKILPSTQQILKQYADDEAKKNKKESRGKKRRRIAIISCIVLILIQVLCLGWWSILSGAATIAVFGGIWFLYDIFKN